MADHFTQFSYMFDVGTAENASRAEQIRQRLAAEIHEAEGHNIGFEMAPDPACSPGALWLSSGGYGEHEHVIAFVLACADAFDLTGRWGFTSALTCSKPRLDGFGGGVHLIDLGQRRTLAWLDCDHRLAGALDPAFDADAGVAQSAPPGGEPAMGRGEPVDDDAEAEIAAPWSRRTETLHSTPVQLGPPATGLPHQARLVGAPTAGLFRRRP